MKIDATEHAALPGNRTPVRRTSRTRPTKVDFTVATLARAWTDEVFSHRLATVGKPIVVAIAVAALLTGLMPASCPANDEVVIENAQVTLIEFRDVPARDTGELRRVVVQEGRQVGKNDLLGQLDDRDEVLAARNADVEYERARAEVDNDVTLRLARKRFEVAQAELNRARESVKQFPKAVSATEMDRLRLVAEQHELEIEHAEHALKLAQLNAESRALARDATQHQLDRRRIVAPIDGVVVEVQRRSGEWVERGTTVFRILRLHQLRVEGFLPASVGTQRLVNRSVVLEMDSDGDDRDAVTKYTGKVTFVSPEADPSTGDVRVWADVDNSQLTLRPGLSGRLRIRTGGGDRGTNDDAR